MKRTQTLLAVIIVFVQTAGCTSEVQSCGGATSAEGVAMSGPAFAAFRDHLKEYRSGSDMDSYFGDIAHYDLVIRTTELTFEYEFVPRSEGHRYKGGGALYTVNRRSGEILRWNT